MSNVGDVRARFGATAAKVAEHGEAQVEMVREQVRTFVQPGGDERALDVGTGPGTLALALAPLVREVVGVDVVPELLEAARRAAPANATFVEADATHLPFESGSFDLACCRRTLHHVARPELVVAELARVTRPGGLIFVDDQIAPVDLRGLFDANELVLRKTRFQQHRRELDYYLDLAGCEGEARERAKALSPGGPEAYVAESGWYLLARRLS
jgi:ubiquinone/menaquinone biosynthesis C-methylase UbiE